MASVFKCRIELRQIGPRDKSKIVGGLGSCGLPLCCSSFLGAFDGVSINMAKNQMLAINIDKILEHVVDYFVVLNTKMIHIQKKTKIS